MILQTLGRNYGDRVGRESIDEGIRGVQGPRNLLKITENGPMKILGRRKHDFANFGEKYGDRVGRESIDEGIRGVQGSKNHRKTIENQQNNFQTFPKLDHALLLAL